MFINVQTGEAFVSAEESFGVNINGESEAQYILTREDGSQKTVSAISFKAWYQEDHEAENREEKQEDGQKVYQDEKIPEPKLTHHQKVAKNQLEYTYNYIVGGYINTVQDGEAETLPPVEDMFDEVMTEATTHLYGEGMCSNRPAPASMNFAGKRFLIDTLVKLFETDGYEVPACCRKVPEKKQTTGSRKYNDDPGEVAEDEVVMRAFTGMLIGVFKIAKQTKNQIVVKTATGKEMKFDRKTGIELNCKNPKFANRIKV